MCQEASGKRSSPEFPVLFRSFEVDGQDYLYDTGTNAIVPLPGGIRPRLEEILEGSGSDLTPPGEVGEQEAALAWVEKARGKSGLFAPRPPRDYRCTLDEKGLTERLETGMRGLLLGVTDQCNLRCSYCVYSGSYPGQRTHGTESMTWETARKSIDHFLRHRAEDELSFVTFYGGEPLLAWDLLEACVRYLRDQAVENLVILVNTNLTLLDESRAAFLAENKVALAVSVDGPAEIHDATRKYASGRTTHGRVLEWLEHLRTRYPDYWKDHVVVHATFARDGDISAVFDFFSGDMWRDLSVTVGGIREEGENSRPGAEEDKVKTRHRARLDRLLSRHLASLEAGEPFAHKLFQNLFRPVFKTLPAREIGYAPVEAMPMRTCIPGATRLYVDAQGTYYPCEKTGVPAARIGDVENGIDLGSVHGLLERQVRFSEANCQRCWAWRLCGLCLTHFLEHGEISEAALQRKCVEERERAQLSLERFVFLYSREPESIWGHPYSLHFAVARAREAGKSPPGP